MTTDVAVAPPTDDAAELWRRVPYPIVAGELAIERVDVHVWTVGLRPAADVLEGLWTTLDAEERARASRFVFERHRLRYVAAHGLLRHVLSGYLGTAPGTILLGQARYGKPYLLCDAAAASGAAIRFNLAHSSDRMLVAVGVGRELGIDLERVSLCRDVTGIARHFFSPSEVAALTALPQHERRGGFFRCWTRKEAYIKACGTGLAMRLDDFDVALAPAVASALLRSERGADEPRRWRFTDLPVGPGFEAAAAVEGDDWRLTTYSLDLQERAADSPAAVL